MEKKKHSCLSKNNISKIRINYSQFYTLKKNSSCNCDMCVVSYINNLIDNVRNDTLSTINVGKIHSILKNAMEYPGEDNDTETLVDLYALITVRCKGCVDHEYRKFTCPTSLLLYSLEAIMTNDRRLVTCFTNILSEKDFSKKYLRIKNKNPEIADRILTSVKKHIAFDAQAMK